MNLDATTFALEILNLHNFIYWYIWIWMFSAHEN